MKSRTRNELRRIPVVRTTASRSVKMPTSAIAVHHQQAVDRRRVHQRDRLVEGHRRRDGQGRLRAEHVQVLAQQPAVEVDRVLGQVDRGQVGAALVAQASSPAKFS